MPRKEKKKNKTKQKTLLKPNNIHVNLLLEELLTASDQFRYF